MVSFEPVPALLTRMSQPPKAWRAAVDQAGAALGRRDVAGVGDDRLAEVLGDLRRGVLGAVAVAGGDEHERALAGEGAGDAEADADAAAGDDRDLAGEA